MTLGRAGLLLAVVLGGWGRSGGAATQTLDSGASEAFSLLDQPAGARALAMGSAFVAVADDDSGQLWNPAAPALAPGVEAGLHHDTWLAGTSRDLMSLQLPVAAGLSAGVFGGLVNYPALDLRDSGGNYLGSYSPQEHLYALTLALRQPGLSVGLTGRYMDQALPGYAKTQTAWDWGLLWNPLQALRLGMVVQAVPQEDGGLSPRGIGGLSFGGQLNDWHWLCAGSGKLDGAGPNELDLGLELSTGRALPLAVRAGFSREFPDTGLSTDQRLSVGFGLGFRDLVLDYAFLPWGDFGATNRLSLRWLQRWRPGEDAGPAPEPDGAPARRVPAVAELPLPAALSPTAAQASSPTAQALSASAAAGTDLHVLSDLAARGRDLQDQGRHGEALRAYQEAVQADPSDLEAWRGQARVFGVLGRQDEARRCWQRVLALDPSDPEAAAAMAAQP
ncbi:MAG TPA: tetratricopeptide repeat protein [bacterium]|nr:tetratricopeptide repeat protein [bacterium]